jgi:hypothetical protein
MKRLIWLLQEGNFDKSGVVADGSTAVAVGFLGLKRCFCWLFYHLGISFLKRVAIAATVECSCSDQTLSSSQLTAVIKRIQFSPTVPLPQIWGAIAWVRPLFRLITKAISLKPPFNPSWGLLETRVLWDRRRWRDLQCSSCCSTCLISIWERWGIW